MASGAENATPEITVPKKLDAHITLELLQGVTKSHEPTGLGCYSDLS